MALMKDYSPLHVFQKSIIDLKKRHTVANSVDYFSPFIGKSIGFFPMMVAVILAAILELMLGDILALINERL